MVLTGCGTRPAVNNKVFLEDTLAHQEIFGGSEGAVDLRVRRTEEETRSLESISAPDIGYQIHFEGDSLAIRFVAAIKETAVKAYWRRGVAAPDGTVLRNKKFSDAAQEANKYYTELTDGNTVIKAGEGKYSGYVGFVIYTIRNIPYTSNKDSYVAAYLNLVGAENSSIHNNSKGLAVKIEKETNYTSANVFAFDPTRTGHFLEGTIDGQLRTGDGLWRESGSTPSGNFAWYDNVTLQAGDSFGSYYYEQDSKFLYYGYDGFFASSENFFNESSLSGYASPIKSGNYKLYVSNGGENGDTENFIYTNVVYFNESVDVWLKPSEKWIGNTSRYSLYYFNSESDNGWVDMSSDGTNIYKAAIPAGYKTVIFCAMNPGTTGNSWDDKWNQSGNVSLTSMVGVRCCFHKSNDGWDGHSNDHFEVHP